MRAIIMGAGKPPGRSRLNFLQTLGYSYIIAADGGAQNAHRLGARVSAVVGDFDSIPAALLEQYRAQPDCEVAHIPGQSDTDTEKCLRFLAERGCDSCVLTAATGDRLDHGLSNLALLLRWQPAMHCALVSGATIAEAAAGDISFSATPGACISIYGFGACVAGEGLAWPLCGEALVFGGFESQSNKASGNRVCLRIHRGSVLVIREFREFQRHGFLPRMIKE